MSSIELFEPIAGVQLARLEVHGDERGRFQEIFRKEWFPQRRWDAFQSNCSFSTAGTLRGLHYHHRQVDYWYVVDGAIRAGLVDLRPGSVTYRSALTVTISAADNLGLFIPVGVAHGFLAVTDAKLIYIVDNYYDGADEHGVAWNDPDIGLDWGVDEPTISPRDRLNPLLRDIAAHQLPGR